MEMFEVFRQRQKADGKTPSAAAGAPSGTPASAAPPPRVGNPLIGTLHRPASLDRRPVKDRQSPGPGEVSRAERPAAAPAAPSVEAVAPGEPAPAALPYARLRPGTPPPESIGDRAITLRYNTALFVLILLAGALFVAFALGVEVGRDRATRDLAFGPKDAAPSEPGISRAGDVAADGAVDSDAFAHRGGETAGAEGKEPLAGTVANAPPPVAAPSARFFTIRLIHYDPTRQGRESAEQMKAWLAARVGAGVFTATLMINGEPQRAVCYGQYPSEKDPQAQEDLRRLKGLNAKSFKHANLLHVERGPQ